MFKAEAIKHWDCDKKLPNGAWVPARPEGGGFSWTWRWKLALDVLTGRADALFWD
jgi:hypothetical protein